jgi:hypothetical protein
VRIDDPLIGIDNGLVYQRSPFSRSRGRCAHDRELYQSVRNRKG